MGEGLEKLPDDIEALHAALLAARAELAIVRAQQSDDQALIAQPFGYFRAFSRVLDPLDLPIAARAGENRIVRTLLVRQAGGVMADLDFMKPFDSDKVAVVSPAFPSRRY